MLYLTKKSSSSSSKWASTKRIVWKNLSSISGGIVFDQIILISQSNSGLLGSLSPKNQMVNAKNQSFVFEPNNWAQVVNVLHQRRIVWKVKQFLARLSLTHDGTQD